MTYVRTSGNIAEQITFIHQTSAVLDQANPISGTKYTVLNTTKNVRIICIMADVAWTVQPTPLEVYVTIDGNTIRHYINNPATLTPYGASVVEHQPEGYQLLSAANGFAPYRAFLYEGRSIKVEAEITGGTVSTLHVIVQFAKREG